MSSASASPCSALAVAGHAAAATVERSAGAALDRPSDRPDEPRVHGDALACGSLLHRALQALGDAQRDARGELLAGAAVVSPLLLDVHELGVLAREANLDVAGRELGRDLERGLREHVEHPEAERRAEHLAEAPGDAGGPLVTQLG